MANITIGSARHDENGNLNGTIGDQLQNGSGNDFKGEVSMQDFYVHKLGWDVIRFKDVANRHKCAERMVAACNNDKIGYSQAQRSKIWTDGIDSKKKTNTDCSALIRQIFKEVTGIDPGNFTTANEKSTLEKTGLVTSFRFKDRSELMTGDILVSCKKGHTAVVVLGKSPEEPKVTYYPKYTGKGTSIVSALATVGEKDTSMNHRKKIAAANGIKDYQGSIKQNLTLIDLIKAGNLIKA